ncbi:heavy-metal-associated domain-containing protein [Rhodoferax saidenbachensis]|uniref:Mercuric ion binding protein n=1 Tax=Rhodoferax saidenbachensis TaxID=1484693 RepID=A0ABU1ZQ57_9BURK|nr:heavy-metal-associated domain-containing protein [Rhodoferax saidenbachensis]MDR7307679.1 mercuric ion binding protein [Rhodoferax saidenbachensis]
MTKITLSLALAVALVQTALPAFATTSVKVTVNGMVCAFCAQGIEKRISKMGATKEVFVDLKKKTVAIEAKEGQTLDDKAIAAEIVDSGYDVVKMETVPQSVAEIRAELKGRK